MLIHINMLDQSRDVLVFWNIKLLTSYQRLGGSVKEMSRGSNSS